MFGYVVINPSELTVEARRRYEGFYCGLCKSLKERFGNQGRVTLSYDMTFLVILLSSLYEPDESESQGFCALHPVSKRLFIRNELDDYVADMNIALAYHKSLDNWRDDRSPAGLMQSKLLTGGYERVKTLYEKKCAYIAECLAGIQELEKSNSTSVDDLVNLTGRMLGEVFVMKDDHWAPVLRCMGEALGRFIYLMDAYEDLPKDVRLRRYNPLREMKAQEHYELTLRDSLALLISECTEAFELLPLVKDVNIMRNILYSGVWMRYAQLRNKAEKKAGKPATKEAAR